MRICICTPYAAHAEPRGPRHARALAELFPAAEVTFFDCAPLGSRFPDSSLLDKLPNIQRITHYYPTRNSGMCRLLAAKWRAKCAAMRFERAGELREGIFGHKTIGLARHLRSVVADVYFAHNIEMLMPAAQAVRTGGDLFFDCMEFYSDMGDGQAELQRRATVAAEEKCLPQCSLITTSSPELSQAYETIYNLSDTLSLYNCPERAEAPPSAEGGGLQLYWRNSVLGFGQRGLEDILEALRELPNDISLFLQGRNAMDGGKKLQSEIERLGLSGRVTVLPPHGPEEAVFAAGKYTIGLCLEREGNRNHELTVSNKIFDYLMAGLAIVAPDLPGLRRVVQESKGGVTFRPGCVESLKHAILSVYQNPEDLEGYRRRARRYGLLIGNREQQMANFKERVYQVLGDGN